MSKYWRNSYPNFENRQLQRCSRAYLEIRIKNLLGEDKIKNEINKNLYSYLINEEKIYIELTDSRQCFPHCSHKNQILWNNNIQRKRFSILLQRYNLWNRIIWIYMWSRYQLKKTLMNKVCILEKEVDLNKKQIEETFSTFQDKCNSAGNDLTI